MERRDIDIFLTLADELHFGRTAERLHLSTARVSQTIKRLERRYGVLLFERTSRRVALTPTGKELYADLMRVRQELDAAEDKLAAAGRGLRGTLTVGFVGARAGQRMLAAAELLRTAEPDCKINIRESPLNKAIEELSDGVIQLLTAMLPVRHPGLSCSPVFFQERRGLAVPAGDPLAVRRAITRADVVAADLLESGAGPLDDWEREVHAAADTRSPRSWPTFQTIEEMLALIGAGRGCAVVPEGASQYYRRPDVRYLPITDAPPFEWGLVWRRGTDTAEMRAFVRTCAALPDSLSAPQGRVDGPSCPTMINSRRHPPS